MSESSLRRPFTYERALGRGQGSCDLAGHGRFFLRISIEREKLFTVELHFGHNRHGLGQGVLEEAMLARISGQGFDLRLRDLPLKTDIKDQVSNITRQISNQMNPCRDLQIFDGQRADDRQTGVLRRQSAGDSRQKITKGMGPAAHSPPFGGFIDPKL